MSAPTRPGELDIEIAGTRLVCLWQRMLFWPEQRTLFVADVHLGKAASFRAAGVPLPSGHSGHDLDRIAALLAAYQATRLVILGDMVHTQASYTEALDRNFRAFRARHHDIDVILVRGNHDRHAGDAPTAWGLTMVAEPHALGPFACCHEPGHASGAGYELAGHLHPALRLQTARDGATLPCFWQHATGIVLPAFGSLTGNYTLRLKRHESAVVIAAQHLHRIKFRE
jgi:DNA ligase-associated metallophosphoesterase